MKKKFLKSNKAFTLIELLVVVAIIGILSAVVISSLNSAREKGKIATIKSTLKQLYNQATLNQLEYGSFVNSNPSYTDLTCMGPNSNLAKIAQPLIDQGVVVKCFSIDFGSNYQRFGATALIYDANELKAWSVDENGVVKWDLRGVDSSGVFVASDVRASWINAKNYCSLSGGRLPSIEQSRALSHSWYSKAYSEDAEPWSPVGFVADRYWSSTPVSSSPSTLSYFMGMKTGALDGDSQSVEYYVHCVR